MSSSRLFSVFVPREAAGGKFIFTEETRVASSHPISGTKRKQAYISKCLTIPLINNISLHGKVSWKKRGEKSLERKSHVRSKFD